MNGMINLNVAALALAATLYGCELEPENIRIEPKFDLPQSLMGRPKSIVIEVADTRATKKLGEVGDPNRKMYDVSVKKIRVPPFMAAFRAHCRNSDTSFLLPGERKKSGPI